MFTSDAICVQKENKIMDGCWIKTVKGNSELNFTESAEERVELLH